MGELIDFAAMTIPLEAYYDDVQQGLQPIKTASPKETGSNPIINDWDVSLRFSGFPPKREWLVPGVFPERAVSLFAGGGGIGKSLILGDLGTKVGAYDGLEKPVMTPFGPLDGGGKVVFWGAEDDAIEVHTRFDTMGVEVPRGQLFWVPLPDAGGVRPLFGFARYGRTPIATRIFNDFYLQLKGINDLSLVVIDPLQAFSGGLDLNDPGHCQFIGTTFGRVASACNCTIILTHHVRKSRITDVEEAREAVRGSGGLIDAVRSAVVVWPTPDDEAVKVCRKLGTEYARNKVANLAVVKANFRADWSVKTLIRDDNGLLIDRSAELTQEAPDYATLMAMLVLEIDRAAGENKPFTKSGEHGVYERRMELGEDFIKMGRDKLRGLVQTLIDNGRLKYFSLDGVENSRHIWLASPNNPVPFGNELGG